jgi:hypothetical protein
VIELPDNLPSIGNAKLPAAYERAKEALSQCSAIDECQNWADKAEALASYAKQAKDDQLRKLADRIQARAIRRCGELLKTFDARGDHRRTDVADSSSQKEAAQKAGLSERQQVTAVRVANIPAEDFEKAVESEDPPTVTELAQAGKKSRLPVSPTGADLEYFAIATAGQDHLRRFAEFAEQTAPEKVAKGSRRYERKGIRQHIDIIERWMDQLFVQLED